MWLTPDTEVINQSQELGATGPCGIGWVGGSTVEVTWRYIMTTSAIQIFATLSSVIFVLLSSLAGSRR